MRLNPSPRSSQTPAADPGSGNPPPAWTGDAPRLSVGPSVSRERRELQQLGIEFEPRPDDVDAAEPQIVSTSRGRLAGKRGCRDRPDEVAALRGCRRLIKSV